MNTVCVCGEGDCSIPISDGVVVTPVGHKGEIDCLIEGAGMR